MVCNVLICNNSPEKLQRLQAELGEGDLFSVHTFSYDLIHMKMIPKKKTQNTTIKHFVLRIWIINILNLLNVNLQTKSD